ncbi:hypothetical protein KTD31_00160 [Burkholderia multivorans]|uniref:hypothetical protein n=1 Tax=Burkholderia multivorans TaxID=87883 RepID=UPI001C21D85C|nr:hypothetical protein [Burkholderia multivorans]MBU9199811.1 hypothetical protein [Burkholderia multivorans]MDN8079070.1 hypothetical protein [Burkholderia multivorans]
MNPEKALYPRKLYAVTMSNRAIYSSAKAPFRWLWALLLNVLGGLWFVGRPWVYASPFGFILGFMDACGSDLHSAHAWWITFFSVGGTFTAVGGTIVAVFMILAAIFR